LRLYWFRNFSYSQLKVLLTAFGQLDFHIVHQGDGCAGIIMVMGDVIEVDQVGLMGAEKALAFKAAFDLLQDFGKHVFFASGSDDLGIPASGNATKDLVPSEKLDSPGGLNRYFFCAHTLSI
jgi:hypothetical protein